MEELIEFFKKNKLTLSCAESLTAGLFAATIASHPGVSSFFKGGVVTYWNEAKTDVLHVDESIIQDYGVVSSECASSMARNVQHLFRTDVSVSFTGNAGPDVQEGKPVGLVYIGVCIKDTVFTFECHFTGSRNEIREACVKEAEKKILKLI